MAENGMHALAGLAVRPIYLDNQATSPLDPRVLEAMLPYMSGPVGNPHSSTNLHGREAGAAVEAARASVASLIGGHPDEIVFTSGATESNNMILRGAAAYAARRGRDRVISVSTEHKAILDVLSALSAKGTEVIILPVAPTGLLDLEVFAAALDANTGIASVMAANNEIGIIQPVAQLAERARAFGVLFHTDAAQITGHLPFDVRQLGIDAASFSSHKMNGPMGIGAAYLSANVRRRIDPLILGGGQQAGMRSGTLPVALCVGFGEACRLRSLEIEGEGRRLESLRDAFLKRLTDHGVSFSINGAWEPRLPSNLNLSFPEIDAEALLMRVSAHLSISSGSACTAESLEPSHVLTALGLGPDRTETAVRISLGRENTLPEVLAAADILARAVARLRSVSYVPEHG